MSNRYLIGRRQFLITSSAAAVAAATIGPQLFAASTSAKRLAVGYTAFEGDGVIRSASSVPAADGGFIGRGARITASAPSPVSPDPRNRRAVELIAEYPYFDGAERKIAPFHAWASSRLNGAKGSPTSFTIPVDEVQKLSFIINAESGAPHGASATRRDLLAEPTTNTPLPLVFSLQNEAGSIPLARGFFVVVPLFENDAEPRWGSLSVRTVGGFSTLVDADGQPAMLEHFLLKIDYAG